MTHFSPCITDADTGVIPACAGRCHQGRGARWRAGSSGWPSHAPPPAHTGTYVTYPKIKSTCLRANSVLPPHVHHMRRQA
eukprot:1161280-Pelagomonas_calceolata.AAC.5